MTAAAGGDDDDPVRLNGHRGAFLLLMGCIHIAVGLSYIYAQPDAAIVHTMSWMPSWSPLWACGLLWVGSGVLALVSAFEPIPADRFGFMGLAAVDAGWVVAHVIAAAVGTAPRGLVSAVIFLALGGAVLVVSGMPNPVHRRTP